MLAEWAENIVVGQLDDLQNALSNLSGSSRFPLAQFGVQFFQQRVHHSLLYRFGSDARSTASGKRSHNNPRQPGCRIDKQRLTRPCYRQCMFSPFLFLPANGPGERAPTKRTQFCV
jgi:hypothetical protein